MQLMAILPLKWRFPGLRRDFFRTSKADCLKMHMQRAQFPILRVMHQSLLQWPFGGPMAGAGARAVVIQNTPLIGVFVCLVCCNLT